MIIKKIRNKSSAGARRVHALINYISEDLKTNAVHAVNMQSDTVPLLVVEMAKNEPKNKRCKDPIEHIVVSVHDDEVISDERAHDIVRIALNRLQYDNCQAVYAIHHDTDNMHISIIVNRTDIETGKVHDDKNDYYKMQAAAAICEHKYGYRSEKNGLYRVENGHIIRTGKHSENNAVSQCIESHTGIESTSTTAKRIVSSIIDTSKTWHELHDRLYIAGVSYEKKNNGAVFGLNIKNKGTEYVKASLVAREYSLASMEKRFGTYKKPKSTGKYKEIVKNQVQKKTDTETINELYTDTTLKHKTIYKQTVRYDAPIKNKGTQYEYDYRPDTAMGKVGIGAAGMSRAAGLSGVAGTSGTAGLSGTGGATATAPAPSRPRRPSQS